MSFIQDLIGIIWVIAQLCLAIFIADFFSGVLHWIEDRYLKRDLPVLGPLIVAANDLHHAEPRAFTRDGFLLRNWPSFFVAGLLVCFFVCFDMINIFTIGLIVASCLLPTQAHYWAHRTQAENGIIITALQRTGLIQSQQQHWQHHRGDKDKYYCTMTNYVNPMLERIKLFQRAEWLISTLFGVKPKTVEG